MIPLCGNYIRNAYVFSTYQKFDIFTFKGINRAEIGKRVMIGNFRIFEEAIRMNKPIIFTELHSGSFFLLAIWFSLVWGKVNVVFVNKSRFRSLIYKKLLEEHILSQVTNYNEIERKLRNRESLLIMVDGIKAKYTETVRIGDEEFYFSNAVIKLMNNNDCVLLPVYSRRVCWNLVEFNFLKIIHKGNINKMQEIFNIYLPHLKKDPSQWYGLFSHIQPRREKLYW